MPAFKSKKTSNEKYQETAEVLYQKIGNKWYAYSVIGEDVYMGSLSEEELLELQTQYQENGRAPERSAT